MELAGVEAAEVEAVDVEAADGEISAPGLIPGNLDGESFKEVLDGKPFRGKDYVFSYLDHERTIRTREYMMDGSGGIWKCSPSGNLLDYTPMMDGEESVRVREELMSLMEGYFLPSGEDFSEDRLERARRNYPWGKHHPATLAAYRTGDEWMHNERRKRE
jgi:hypothetical protein